MSDVSLNLSPHILSRLNATADKKFCAASVALERFLSGDNASLEPIESYWGPTACKRIVSALESTMVAKHFRENKLVLEFVLAWLLERTSDANQACLEERKKLRALVESTRALPSTRQSYSIRSKAPNLSDLAASRAGYSFTVEESLVTPRAFKGLPHTLKRALEPQQESESPEDRLVMEDRERCFLQIVDPVIEAVFADILETYWLKHALARQLTQPWIESRDVQPADRVAEEVMHETNLALLRACVQNELDVVRIAVKQLIASPADLQSDLERPQDTEREGLERRTSTTSIGIVLTPIATHAELHRRAILTSLATARSIRRSWWCVWPYERTLGIASMPVHPTHDEWTAFYAWLFHHVSSMPLANERVRNTRWVSRISGEPLEWFLAALECEAVDATVHDGGHVLAVVTEYPTRIRTDLHNALVTLLGESVCVETVVMDGDEF